MTVYIDEELCKGCKLCVYNCPQGIIQMTDNMNRKGFNLPEITSPEKCTHCKICEVSCPDLAIFVKK